jgi:hypothetical protein
MEVTGGRRKLHTEELLCLYSLPDIRVINWKSGLCETRKTHGYMWIVYKNTGGTPSKKTRQLTCLGRKRRVSFHQLSGYEHIKDSLAWG